MDHTETIVAISSPRGEGGVGLVRLSGPKAMEIGREVFRCTPPLGSRPRHVEYGRVTDGERDLDRGLAWFFESPHSYSGEDTVEISTHGSAVVLEALVQAAIASGAVLAAPGEFTRRAFTNGRLDLLQAEAVIDIIRANSRAGLDNAYGQASGRLSGLVNELKQIVVSSISSLELELDFSEEDNEPVGEESIQHELRRALTMVSRLIDTFEGTRRRQTGVVVCLLGLPNAGKSTLFNSMLGDDRAIVAPQPGTTRDLIEARTTWSGETVRLMDTAGFRTPSDAIEREGVQRTLRCVAEADLVLVVVDCSEAWREIHADLLTLVEDKDAFLVSNKCDLPSRFSVPAHISMPAVKVSGLHGEGVAELQNIAVRRFPPPKSVDGVGLAQERHRDCLLRMANATASALDGVAVGQPHECVVVELRTALAVLAEMLGETLDEEILDRVFSEFCIGK